MAKPEHVEIVKQGAEAIREWREKNPGVSLDLGSADLRDANLIGADLSRAYLCDAILSNSKLSKAKLIKAILVGVNLSGADLTDANLYEADLRSADLSGADLSDADLNEANLRRANLNGAELLGAHLSGAIIFETNLSAASLHAASLVDTVFGDVDLSVAVGLDNTYHYGPSSIGIDTLLKSRGKIPEAFLRGCGVPENVITYIPSLVAQPIEFYSCFISYSHADKSFARRLHDALQGRDIRCWLDEKHMLPGDDIYEQVDHGIRLWDKVLLVASKDSLNSGWVEREIDTAIEKEMKLRKKRGKQTLAIIPLNLDDQLFDWSHSHAATIRKRLAANFVGWENDNAVFEREFENVVKSLRTDEGGREPPPEPKL